MKETPISSLPGIPMLLALLAAIAAGAWIAITGGLQGGSVAQLAAGLLLAFASLVAEAGANIDEVHHQRAFSSLSAQNVEVELVLQTRNPDHVAQVVQRLQDAGFAAAAY